MHVAATSHGWVAVPHVVPAAAYKAGHANEVPSHRSCASHGPASVIEPHAVPDAAGVFAGQEYALPVQVAATSQGWLAVPHTVPAPAYGLDGQVADAPVQFASSSHGWVAVRHTVVDGAYGLLGQVADVPVQVASSSHGCDAVLHTVPEDA